MALMALTIASLPITSASASASYSRSCSPTVIPLSSSTSLTSSIQPLIYSGRGDKKTAKGKRFNHSFGNISEALKSKIHLKLEESRPRNKKKGRVPTRVAVPPGPIKGGEYDREVLKIEINESLFSE